MQKYVIALYIRLSLEDYKYDSTVLQVRNPRDERHKVRRQDDSFKEVMGQAIRAINAYLRLGQALRAR